MTVWTLSTKFFDEKCISVLHSCNVPRSVSNHNGVAEELTSRPARVYSGHLTNRKKTKKNRFIFIVHLGLIYYVCSTGWQTSAPFSGTLLLKPFSYLSRFAKSNIFFFFFERPFVSPATRDSAICHAGRTWFCQFCPQPCVNTFSQPKDVSHRFKSRKIYLLDVQ